MAQRVEKKVFDENRPESIDGIAIVEVTRFNGGSVQDGTYAAAAALTRTGTGAWATHTLVYNDDSDTWFLHQGHYDFADRASAEADLATRSTW